MARDNLEIRQKETAKGVQTQYRCRYAYYSEDKKRHQGHTKWCTSERAARKEAERKVIGLTVEAKENGRKERSKAISTYMDEYEEYIRKHRLDDSFSASERRSVLMRMKAIRETITLAGITAGTLDERDIARWEAELEDKISERTGTVISDNYYNLLVNELNKFLTWVNRRLRDPLPATAKLKRKRKSHPAAKQHTQDSDRWDYYTLAEWTLISQACGFTPEEIKIPKSDEPLHIADFLTAQQYGYLILNFLFHEGLRPEEMQELRWRDIDFTNNEIHVSRANNYRIRAEDRDAYASIRATKNHTSMRTIPMYHDEMPEDPYSDIRSYLSMLFNARTQGIPEKKIASKMKDELVFPSRDHPGQVYTPHPLDMWLRRFAETTGLRRIRVMGLRHSFAEWQCKKRLMPRDVLKSIMGHVDERMLNMVYAPATQEERYDKVKAWEQAQRKK